MEYKLLNRREFVRGAIAIGLSVVPVAAGAEILNYDADMPYRPLGTTGHHVSLLSMGGLVMVEPVYHYAIERGLNFVDTSPSYRGGMAIRQLGNVLQSKRAKVYVACKYHSYVPFEDNLRDLKTDYVDFIVFNHHDRESALRNDDREVFEKLKRAGKVRFAALMTHGDVKEVLASAIKSGMYSFVTPGLNQPGLEAYDEEVRAARQRGVGVVAMKALRGIEDSTLQLALLKKLAANPAITSVLTSIGSYELFDAYRKALQQPLAAAEDHELHAYAVENRAKNCMMCGRCQRACPRSVDISTVLRSHDYYYVQLRDPGRALETYRGLPVERLAGIDCGDCRRCEAVCPNGIPILERMKSARETFSRLA
jgi:hypothetical protein